jgi:hypothetical protein
MGCFFICKICFLFITICFLVFYENNKLYLLNFLSNLLRAFYFENFINYFQ